MTGCERFLSEFKTPFQVGFQDFCVHRSSHREKGARDLVPLLLREKGLGDEGARYLYNARPISLLA
ncbi:hypothetical protein FDUTEX481_03191 [Tolypothrix sp. PCC 7601]|nr:hypothetical protein FDUTEX481_03191 [Tolypothrix sp. PCC 7601]